MPTFIELSGGKYPETLNLASRHPELVEEMSALWYDWAADCGVVDWALLGE